MKLPIKILTSKKKLNGYAGFSFFIFIFIAKEAYNKKRTEHHETIHFYQQVELLFVGMWILYVLSYFYNIIKYGKFREAYLNIPFEKEAYDNDEDYEYLKKRKLYSWVKYI